MSKERKLLKKALKYVGLSSNDLAEDLYDEIDQLLTQPERDPVTNEPTTTAMAVMPNGVCVSNVYDAYEEGRKSIMSEQEPEFGDGPEFDGWEKRSGNSFMQEPLSDDEIVKIWANKSPANEFECVRLVEQAHGIGGQK